MATAVDVCKGMYASFVAGDEEAVLAQLADDVDYHLSSSYPAGGKKKGVIEVRQFMRHLKETSAFSKFHPEQFMASCDGNDVCVVVRIEGTSVATGKAFAQDVIHLWHFSPEMKVTRMQEWVDDHPGIVACFHSVRTY